ncbi:hypothetical protein SARC_09763, partial [Sphaeroforma arctica JP610]
PALLFERYTAVGKPPSRYFACSAFRDRKLCPFYRTEDDVRRKERKRIREGLSDTLPAKPVSSRSGKEHRALLQEARTLLGSVQNPISGSDSGKTKRKHAQKENSKNRGVRFCPSCACLVTPRSLRNHADHKDVVAKQPSLTLHDLEVPTEHLRALDNDQSNAQYFFAKETATHMVSEFRRLGYRNILCIGTPRLHEMFIKNGSAVQTPPTTTPKGPVSPNKTNPSGTSCTEKDKSKHKTGTHTTAQIVNDDSVHEPQATASEMTQKAVDEPVTFSERERYLHMLRRCDAVVIDPPFAMLPEVLATCVRRVQADWLCVKDGLISTREKIGDSPHSTCENSRDTSGAERLIKVPKTNEQLQIQPHSQTHMSTQPHEKTLNPKPPSLPTYLIMPYFMEPKLHAELPELRMHDYRVQYDNHSTYKTRHTGTSRIVRDSPVRLYTNVPLKLWVPSPAEDYRFCSACDRYVALVNAHCAKCSDCTTKHGPTTNTHCDKCQKCVTAGSVHCDTCMFCVAPSLKHVCEVKGKQKPSGMGKTRALPGQCHICGKTSHKRKDCPKRRKAE